MAKTKGDLVTWSTTFSVGIKVIDDQHKELLNLVNDMFNHAVGDEYAERVYFKEIIQKAIDYVKVHFSTEEKIMLHTRFSGYAEHKKEHDAFILAVVDNVRDFEAGKRLTLTDFTRFLKEWILTHIAIMDKQYFAYFKQIATRKEDGTLSITQADVMR
ncbi:MAG: bacteriohemerythrin [Treponema sp.]|jgi:hemerythrin|nr:bacteriohemerythrin [Treponema sp.]